MDILFINACVRDDSRTKQLADAVLNKLTGDIHEIAFKLNALPPLDHNTLEQRSVCIRDGNYDDESFRYAKTFAASDLILIAAPYWDLSFPSCLRTYIEHIMVQGITFVYTPQGIPQSLCKAKKLIYVSTAGGAVIGSNAGYEYVKQLANLFWGVQDTQLFQAENLDIEGADVDGIMRKALNEIEICFP